MSPVEVSFLPFFALRNLFFYRKPVGWCNDEEFMDGGRMKDALRKLLQFYPHLTGRLRRDESNGSATLEYRTGDGLSHATDGVFGGVPFVTATSNASLSELPLTASHYRMSTDLPPSLKLISDYDFQQALSYPPMSIQFTRFACGGVCIGVHLHHYVCDGEGFFSQLMRDWTEVYRGKPVTPPTLDRSWLQPTDESVAAAIKQGQREQGGFIVMGKMEPPPEPASDAELPVSPVFRFTSSELQRMKQAAISDMDSNNGWVSTFEVLTAHLVRCMHAARMAIQATTQSLPSIPAETTSPESASASTMSPQSTCSPNSVSSPSSLSPALSTPPPPLSSESSSCSCKLELDIATNLRHGRLGSSHPSPAKAHCNAVLPTKVRLPNNVLDSSASKLSDTAALVHEALRTSTSDPVHWHETLAWLASQPKKDHIVQSCTLVHQPCPRQSATNGERDPTTCCPGSRGLILSSWVKFSTYECAMFEPGIHPCRIWPPHTRNVPGLCTLIDVPAEFEGGDDETAANTVTVPSSTGGQSAACGIEAWFGMEAMEMEYVLKQGLMHQYR